MSANLATIDDAAEASFLLSKFPGGHWVGGIKEDPGGAFQWIDGGNQVPLTMFGEDDPNSRFLPACTYRAGDGTLRDQACDGSEGGLRDAICEARNRNARD